MSMRLVLLGLLLSPIPAVAEDVTIAAGTMLEVRLETALDSDSTHEGDAFKGTLLEPLQAAGVVILSAQGTVEGIVSSVKSRGAGNTSSVLGLRLTKLHPVKGGTYDIEAGVVGFRKQLLASPAPVTLTREKGEKAVILIGKEGEGPGDRSSSVVGLAGEAEEDLATRWGHSGLSNNIVIIDPGSEITFELHKDVKLPAAQ
jgi:hypothetical protein